MLRVYVGGGSIRMVSNSNNNNNNNNNNNDNRIKVKRLLHEIFQFNAQDLDFGIYRILNLKRKEIERFIEKDLIDAVEREFKEYSKANTEELKKEVEKLYEEIKRDFGSDTFDSEGKAVKYRDTPKVREYEQKREELNNASISKMQMKFLTIYTSSFLGIMRMVILYLNEGMEVGISTIFLTMERK
jgi:hypothetical protein